MNDEISFNYYTTLMDKLNNIESKLDDTMDKTNLIDKRLEIIELKLQLMSMPKLKHEDKKDE